MKGNAICEVESTVATKCLTLARSYEKHKIYNDIKFQLSAQSTPKEMTALSFNAQNEESSWHSDDTKQHMHGQRMLTEKAIINCRGISRIYVSIQGMAGTVDLVGSLLPQSSLKCCPLIGDIRGVRGGGRDGVPVWTWLRHKQRPPRDC